MRRNSQGKRNTAPSENAISRTREARCSVISVGWGMLMAWRRPALGTDGRTDDNRPTTRDGKPTILSRHGSVVTAW